MIRKEIAAWSLLALGYLFLLFFVLDFPAVESDPDRYYHLFLSKYSAEHGLPRQLPQLELMGWSKNFIDKEYLFHRLTTFAYRLGGDGAVLALVPVLSLIFLGLVMHTAARFIPPYGAAFFVGMACLMTPRALWRLSLLRPHLLGLIFFFLVLDGIIGKRKWVAFIGAAAFALSYHAFYLPLALVLGAAALNYRDKEMLRVCAFALVGIMVGIVVNPYFPGTFELMWSHLKAAFNQSGTFYSGIRPVIEVQKIPPISFFFLNSFHLTAVAASAWLFWRGPRFLAAVTLGLWAVTFYQPRALEYAAAISAIGLAAAIAQLLEKDQLRQSLIWILPIWLAFPVVGYIRHPYPPNDFHKSVKYLEAVAKISPLEKGLVINTDFALGHYLLYARPDVKVFDVLGEIFTMDSAPHEHRLRAELIEGKLPRPELLVSQFRSKYVFTRDEPLIQQLDAAAEFKRLYPEKPAADDASRGVAYLFEKR